MVFVELSTITQIVPTETPSLVEDPSSPLLNFLEKAWWNGENLDTLTSETGFTRGDLAVLLAGVPSSFHPEMKQAIQTYAAMRDRFFTTPEDPDAYHQYRDCLLTIMYGDRVHRAKKAFDAFESGLDPAPAYLSSEHESQDLRHAVVYELYADLFTKRQDGTTGGFAELTDRLPYLRDLGVTHVWVLPPFDSPGLDAGFDIRNRKEIDASLGGTDPFVAFVQEARQQGITVMVDMVANHLSFESSEFQKAADPTHPEHKKYHGWFIFRNGSPDQLDTDDALKAWKIFGGMYMPSAGAETYFSTVANRPKTSNWTVVDTLGKSVYNRFMPQMPDLNYNNFHVMVNELSIIEHWIQQVNGPMIFRYDALKHMVKRDRDSVHRDHRKYRGVTELVESYGCDNLPQVLAMNSLLRAFVEHRYQGTVQLVTEVWDSPETVKRYCGSAGEGNHQFGFDLMSNTVRTLYEQNARFITEAILHDASVPKGRTYISLLRHHDAISGQDVGDRAEEKEMAQLPQFQLPEYVLSELQHFYPGFDKTTVYEETGISARLWDFISGIEGTSDPEVVRQGVEQAFALLFFVGKTPMVYMGDEFGQRNDFQHLLKRSIGDGINLRGVDMRHACRAIESLDDVLPLLQTGEHTASHLHAFMRRIIQLRTGREYSVLSEGIIVPVQVHHSESKSEALGVFAAYKHNESDGMGALMVANLTREQQTVKVNIKPSGHLENLYDVLTGTSVPIVSNETGMYFHLSPKATYWLV